uniref:Activin_recp domain-containing protein n=1 Tax=Elaeophora elaphi TaxID=1147741 RepID=A0A0R3S357_9BILA
MRQVGFIAFFLINHYSLSLLCYDCYDTGPSNEKCVKSRNCTGEACLLYEGEDMLLTTAFCLLNLPTHYRKRNKLNDAKCWMERNGRGKHCICSQNFCNQLRDRRILSQDNIPLINASMINDNPLIDYDYANENEADFTFDLMHLENHTNNIGNDRTGKDLIPIEMESADYRDVLESSFPRPIRPTLSLSPLSTSSSSNNGNEYQKQHQQQLTTDHTLHAYAANEEMKRKQPHISTN